MVRVLEGTWEEVSRQIDLRGKHVQIVFNDQSASQVVIRETAPAGSSKSWLDALQLWVESHEKLNHVVDDSRESIYGDLDA